MELLTITGAEVQGFWGFLSVVIVTLIGVYQIRFQKMTDIKVEEYKKELTRKSNRRNDNTSKVWGEIHHLLGQLRADRVYIIQTYPLGRNDYITVEFEVTTHGVAYIKESLKDLHMKDVPKFCSVISSTDFLHIRSLNDMEGMRARALFATNGTQQMYIHRLKDSTYDWIGSLVCDYTTDDVPSEDEARRAMEVAALNIQYILPEIQFTK